MLNVAIIDANEKANRAYAGLASSVVAGWLTWECKQAQVTVVPPEEADLVLLCFSGALDYVENCRRYLKRYGIEPSAARRQGRPYVITGGPADAIPFAALEIADALAVGEAYTFVRQVLGLVTAGQRIAAVRDFIVAYPHAIERSQLAGLERDRDRPWLLVAEAPKLASPDAWVDWAGVPPVRSDDKVVRLIGSKGCHFKCAFCATTYRQTYRKNENEAQVLGQLRALKRQGERVQILSNDPLNLPYFRAISSRLDSQSFTVQEVKDRDNRMAIIRSGVGIARFGVEGVSPRIRKAFGKPITDDELIDALVHLHEHKINTHMFFIVGSPYETADDWADFRSLYERLTRTLHRGICRVKMTTFVPTPPAPLARYVPDLTYEREVTRFRSWVSGNAASRHMVYIQGRGGRTHTANVAEQLAVPLALAETLVSSPDGTVDLAPTLEEFRRMTAEVVAWPLPDTTRWKVGNVYRAKMTSPRGEPVAD